MDSATTSEEHVSISIDEKLAGHSDVPPERCIFKVREKLRKINPDAYEPEVLAIGPYHREKANVKGMEEFKLQYLKSLLARKKETSAERYVIAMRELEEKARKCYAEPISLTSDQFVHMMLLDGCFIIELFLKYSDKDRRDKNDPIFRADWMIDCLRLDLILFENQLPFFILLKLYELIIEDPKPDDFFTLHSRIIRFIHIAFDFFKGLFKCHGLADFDRESVHNVQHLLGLLHSSICPPLERSGETMKWEDIQCTSKLQKAGVKFKEAEGKNLFDITYSNCTMRIPHLTIDDDTESLFRNLIMHEHYGDDGNSFCYISNYCSFMDDLIDKPEDLGLLCHDGIITNLLGDDEKAATMFNTLCYGITINDLFSYGNIYNDVNTHCRKRRHRWMATLKRDYFNSPWALISFVAAFVLLLLTIMQTVLTACSYFVHKS